jgi:TP901 family phage tail tape measure protein
MARDFSVFVNIGGKVLPSLAGAVASAKAQIAGLERASRGLKFGGIGGGLAAVAAAQARNARRLERAQSEMLGAVGAGWGLKAALTAPIKASVEFETRLEDIGQKADLSGAALTDLGRRIRVLGPQINQSPLKVAGGIDVLMGFGAKPEDAEAMMGSIGKAATAYRAEIEDLAKASFAVVDTLKVPAVQVGQALDIMAQAGKEGAFEIRDMAEHFASLTASAQALKMTGPVAVARLAGALQIARKGAADGSEAATNTANLLQKIISPETTKKFKKLGVDIRKELKRTQESGGDIFEMIAAQTMKALGGDLSKLGDIFEDAQVQKFLRPLIQNLDEYRRIRDKSLGARGVVDKDFARRMETAAAVSQGFAVQVERLHIALGNALLPAMTDVLKAASPMVDSLEKIAAEHPVATRAIVATTAGLVGLRVAAAGAKFALGWMWGGALLAAKGALLGLAGAVKVAQLAMLPFGAAARAARTAVIGLAASSAIVGVRGGLGLMAGAALAALNPLRLLRGVAIGVGVALRGALMFSGIGAAIVAIGTAGTFIYKNWSGLGAMFRGIGEGIKQSTGVDIPSALSRAGSAVWEFGKSIFTSVAGPLDLSKEKWANLGTKIGMWIGDVGTAIANLPQTIGAAWNAMVSAVEAKASQLGATARAWVSDLGSAVSGAAGQLYSAGVALIDSLWAGLKARFDAILGWARGLGARIGGAIGGVFSGAPAPAASAARGAPAVAPAIAGSSPATVAPEGRAIGGPVVAGVPYIVGERGPELFIPGASGAIATNSAYRSLTAAGSSPATGSIANAMRPVSYPSARDVSEAAAAAGGGSGAGSKRGDIHITNHWAISGADDPRRVADFVDRRFRDLMRRLESSQRSMLSD